MVRRRASKRTFRALFSLLLAASTTVATVTVYTSEQPAATSTNTAFIASYSVASTDQTVLQPPGVPQDQGTSVPVQLFDGGMPTGMGLPVDGSFLGFSIELSVAAMLMGETAQILRPEFLNYLAILETRAGSVTIRVGGNTQDAAVLNMTGNPDGKTIQKYQGYGAAPTDTPVVHFTPDLFYTMAQISKLLNVNWFFGIPFLDVDADGNAGLVTSNALNILGPNLLGLQLANEPDLYGPHEKKQANYSVQDFFNDTATMIQRLPIKESIIVGPSICCEWNIDDLLNDGYMDQFSAQLKFIDVMHYPNNNCATGADAIIPQDVFPTYLNHQQVQSVLQPYFGAASRAVAAGKKFMMMETNTASCGGFPGVSDAFASALWAVDYGLQMAYGNFSYGLIHFGGQNVYYNPFTPPPTNMTKYRQWSTGAIYYANVVVAEAIGKSGNAQVVDLFLDGNNVNRAGYAVYEQGTASRAVFVNYVSDSSGASDYTAVISIGGGQTTQTSQTPSSVRVKYLLADSVSEKYNITWAGQNMGMQFMADGRWTGTLNVTTLPCDTQAQTCTINVPAPAVALVFLTDEAYQNSGGDALATERTFATTTTTGKQNAHATIDLAALKTSNGRSGGAPLGSTSKGGAVPSGALRRLTGLSIGISMIAGLVGAFVVLTVS